MAAVIRITSPNASPSHFTNATSIVLGGRANMIVYEDPQSADPTEINALFGLLDQTDGITTGIAATLNPALWTIRHSDNIYDGSAITWVANDEIFLQATLRGADPSPPGSPTISYDGDPTETWTPLGASLATLVDALFSGVGGRTTVLTYRGEITNSAGTSAFTVNDIAGDGRWQSNSVSLLRGTNTLVVFAKDDLDNEVSDTIVITQGYPRGRTRQRSAR